MNEPKLASLMLANIVRFALFESVAILGFMIAFTSRDMTFTFIASAVALAGFIVFFPTADRVKKSLLSATSRD